MNYMGIHRFRSRPCPIIAHQRNCPHHYPIPCCYSLRSCRNLPLRYCFAHSPSSDPYIGQRLSHSLQNRTTLAQQQVKSSNATGLAAYVVAAVPPCRHPLGVSGATGALEYRPSRSVSEIGVEVTVYFLSRSQDWPEE
jgi:hypothetical protein